jgi:hypothetical protein
MACRSSRGRQQKAVGSLWLEEDYRGKDAISRDLDSLLLLDEERSGDSNVVCSNW